MMLTCSTCHARSYNAQVVRTEQSPNGLEVGVCVNCDRAKCGKCRNVLGPTDRRCAACGAAVLYT